MKRTFVLAILDGWGLGSQNFNNPIYAAEPKAINYIQDHFLSGALQASGIAVGLPWEEEGNSEVGHLTIGAGKILYQHYPRISLTIKDGSFFQNQALKKIFEHTRQNQSAVHLVGLLTQGNVHASLDHVVALLEMAKRENCQKLYLHLFTDGRDSPPRSALNLLDKILEAIKQKGVGVIADIAGRHYGMDRDKHWDRTEKVYQILTGASNLKSSSLKEPIEKTYARGLNDEYVEPTVIEPHPLADNDGIIFFNFREDRMKQIVETLTNPSFDKFPIKKFKNLFIITMTEYEKNLPVEVAFPNETIDNPLGKVLADNGKIQLRVAETEKYAHVTFFFNGLRQEPFLNEYRVLIPSQKVVHHDEHPEMMARAITDRVLVSLNEGVFDFILLNYANPDMIAHTGNYEATVQAIKVVDQEIERLFKAVLEANHILLITADHGNAEVLFDTQTGRPETQHNISPVPIYLVAREFQKNRTQPLVKLPTIGLLADVAPTILEILRLPIPSEMTGQSLLNELI